MKKLVNKVIKSLTNEKCTANVFLYFFIPIIVLACLAIKENDLWFLLNHGKYVLQHGIPHVEPFTIHQGFSFVMQQWLTSVIFYVLYSKFSYWGLFILLEVVNFAILFVLYKLCMVLSHDKYKLSVILSVITDTLLIIFKFINTRPQLFTLLNLLLLLLVIEIFYKKSNYKVLYILPVISILQINLHASMWFMLFVFMLPYVADLIYKKIKNKKDNRIFKILLIMIIMFGAGFINPYGIKAITYVIGSYGNVYINSSVLEMSPLSLSFDKSGMGTIALIIYFIIIIMLGIYLFYKNGKFKLRHILLFLGTTFLSLANVRNIGLFLIGTIPFLSSYVKESFKPNNKIVIYTKKFNIKRFIAVIFLILYTTSYSLYFQKDIASESSVLKEGITYLLDKFDASSITLYTNYNYGAYAEYRGIKTYIDPRAEVFLKQNNKKEDIFEEYYNLSHNYNFDFAGFLNKYNFTHLIVNKNENLYFYLKKEENYKIIFDNDKYVIFENETYL